MVSNKIDFGECFIPLEDALKLVYLCKDFSYESEYCLSGRINDIELICADVLEIGSDTYKVMATYKGLCIGCHDYTESDNVPIKDYKNNEQRIKSAYFYARKTFQKNAIAEVKSLLSPQEWK